MIHAHFRPEFGPKLAPKWGSAGEVGEGSLGTSEPELALKASESLGPPDTAWSIPVGAASAKRAGRRERTDLDGSGRRREGEGGADLKGRLEIETRRFETRSFPKFDCK